MRTLKVLAVLGLAVALVGSIVVPALAKAVAEAIARSALTWTSASVSTSTTNPPASCQDSNWNILASTGPLTCRSPAAGGPESAIAVALARLGWSARVETTVIGSTSGAEVEVQGPDPKNLPDQVDTLKITVTAKKVQGKVPVTVTFFKRSQPKDKAEALAPIQDKEVQAKVERLFTAEKSEEITVTLKEKVNKNELVIEFGVAVSEPVPTLTEWGLIALAVLLMGGMGYMLYRRRPALRPAAP